MRLEQVGDAVEGNAGGCGFVGGEHGCGSQGAHTVFLVELIHCGEKAGATARVVEAVEEVERVEAFGNQAVEMDADEVGLVVFGAGAADGGVLAARDGEADGEADAASPQAS